MIGGDLSLLVPTDAKAVDPSSVDVDLTATFANQPFVRALYNGSASAAGMKVVTLGGNTVTYANIPSGARIFGLFATLKHDAATTATGIIAEK